MSAYFLKRFLLIIPTFLGITVVVFTITRMVPGGPIERMMQQAQVQNADGGGGTGASNQSSGPLSDEQLEDLKKFYGFDKPTPIAYLEWLGKILVLDFGHSTRYYEPVWEIIKERLPISAFYGITTMILTYLICIPLGLIKALKHSSPFDNISSFFVFVGYAAPAYVVAIFLLVWFASQWGLFPLGGFTSEEFEELTFFAQIKDILYHAVLPLTSYVIGSFAVMTFLMKNSLMDNLASDYVRTAIAKGLPFNKAVYKHALRNSLIPMATHFGNNISVILTGSFLIEKVFNIDGLGLLGYESIVERDYPVVMGTLVISSILFLIGNILSDICVALVDPRVQFR